MLVPSFLCVQINILRYITLTKLPMVSPCSGFTIQYNSTWVKNIKEKTWNRKNPLGMTWWSSVLGTIFYGAIFLFAFHIL